MLDVRIIPDSGEPYDLRVGTRDVVVWEKVDRLNTVTRLESDPKMTDLYAVSHIAAKRQGMFTGTLAEWETSVDLELGLNGEVDPTQLAH
jgi:hypothetical protein